MAYNISWCDFNSGFNSFDTTDKVQDDAVAERDQFAVEISLPDGTPIALTARVADSLRLMLSKDERIVSVTQFVGMSSPRFHISYAPKCHPTVMHNSL